MKEIKNKIEHNEGILREIWNRIMEEIWSIIPTSLLTDLTDCSGPDSPNNSLNSQCSYM